MMFKIQHLDRFAIISNPCTVIVKAANDITDKNKIEDGSASRWLVNLKAISEVNLNLLNVLEDVNTYDYTDISHMFMVGALWETQVLDENALPVKGERIIATFDYVKGVLMCTSLTAIPRTEPKLFIAAEHAMSIFNELKKF